MGVKGLWSYIEHHDITYLPPKEGANAKLPYAVRPRHLFLDMNAIVHISYSSKQPNSKATLQAVKTAVMTILRRIQPSDTLVLAFDGVAPIAKLVEQKERRKGLSPERPPNAPKPSPAFLASPMGARFSCDYAGTEVPLRQQQITAGSEFLYACEFFIVDYLNGLEGKRDSARDTADEGAAAASTNASGKSAAGGNGAATATWKRLILSSCTEPGEGEVKISHHIRQIWQRCVKNGSYDAHDAITIVGNDSDLVLVALAATPYRYLTIVDPTDYTMTCISELLDHWSNAVQNPPLPADLLPSWRMDFVFIMLLSGCDYYDGVRQHAVELWRRYRDLRGNQGFYRRQLFAGPDFTLDVNFLRRLTEKTKSFMKPQGRQKGGSHRRQQYNKQASCNGKASHGVELLKGALWNFRGYVLGRCVDYQYTSSIKGTGEISLGSLRAAAERHGIGRDIGAAVTDSTGGTSNTKRSDADGTAGGVTVVVGRDTGVAGSPTSTAAGGDDDVSSTAPLLSALGQCLAVLGVRGRYSPELRLTIDTYTQDNGSKLTMSQSTTFLVETVQMLLSKTDMRRLSEAERALAGCGSGIAEPKAGSQVVPAKLASSDGQGELHDEMEEEDEAAFMVHAKIRPKAANKPPAATTPSSPETTELSEGTNTAASS